MGRLEGKVAIITGGASGIGEGSVRRFVEEGARVVLSDIQDERGAAIAADLGPAVAYLRTDVSREADVKAAVDLALDRFGRLDCMYNNAGFGGVSGPIHKTDMGAAYDATIAVNLTGVILGMKHAAAAMIRQGSGSIISTSSTGALQGGMGAHVYSATKAGIVGITRSIALELAPKGVRVNAICPGGIATDILAAAFGDSESEQSVAERVQPYLAKFQPVPRAGLPEDIANMAVFLASDESTFVTGQAMVVDGGGVATNDGLRTIFRAILADQRAAKA